MPDAAWEAGAGVAWTGEADGRLRAAREVIRFYSSLLRRVRCGLDDESRSRRDRRAGCACSEARRAGWHVENRRTESIRAGSDPDASRTAAQDHQGRAAHQA